MTSSLITILNRFGDQIDLLKEGEWFHSNIFYTCSRINGKVCGVNMIVDGGGSKNVIAQIGYNKKQLSNNNNNDNDDNNNNN